MGGVGPAVCESFLVSGNLCLCPGGWSWISSLWSAVQCPVVGFGVSIGLA